MNNNKGVTLVELLIVIVVMGIIALFAVPAVGNILENVGKDKIIADATVLEDQLDIICLDIDCSGDTNITWLIAKDYIELDDPSYYNLSDTSVVAASSSGVWSITLLPASGSTDLGWPDDLPSDYDTKIAKRGHLAVNP